MNLKEQILNDIKEAMKQKDDFKRDTLRTLNAAFKQVEVDERIELSDERILKIIASEIKKRKDAIELYSKGGREDLAQKEQKEIALFESYLPQQLSDEELQAALKEMIANLGVSSLKDQGLVMKEAKAKFGARVDGKRLNVTLRELLN
ncbi:GatB/YqeY domain-containing protein [Campylobacter coli]|uniref:GatB/YqeY domain-containing protein n=3 Tax=Campylobacter coli TaxID=195 RepID=A0A0Q2I9Q6_CAMCO|nr:MULTISPECIES: GatB/YqeY domain-containing protein [Campylobacter]EAI7421710.1 GatB/YqeY domain-containing protein [Campylobacter hyointestinalis]EAK5659628.1 GatB/YqeY domain-containing protein [Campylobacter fetus]EIA56919.1 GatB/YqeY family protein [Campylobacter coli 2692]EIA58234.1 GatB/YqeY family protein [Campylobacter coli 2698]EIA72146.1 GatB/YqeY family protein [Campylobacter coli 7--1]EIA73486.1 GatB/YqeY family protein [Campylobacter coli 1891]EIA74718.1 GatB/YqeY family protei